MTSDVTVNASDCKRLPLRLATWCACLTFALVGAMSMVHRVGLAVRNSGDFSTLYSATRVWTAGGNPYDQSQIVNQFATANSDRPPLQITRLTPSVYPPGTFVLITPFATFPRWATARDAWLCVNLCLVAALIWGLVDVSELPWISCRALLVAAIPLWMSSVHDGVSIGNPALAATAALILAVAVSRRGLEMAAGVLLAIAVTLKPQVGGPFVAYFLLRRQWRASTVAVLGAVAMTALAVGRLEWASVDWVATLAANVRDTTVAGACNDPTWHNPERFQLVNLQVLIQTAVTSQRSSGLIAMAAAVALGLLFSLKLLRLPSGQADWFKQPPAIVLAELGFVSAWLLLPIYHRWLDTAPLTTAIVWAILVYSAGRWTTLAAVALFAAIPAFSIVPGIRSRLIDPSAGSHPAAFVSGLAEVYPCGSYCVLAAVMLWAVHRSSDPRAMAPQKRVAQRFSPAPCDSTPTHPDPPDVTA